MNNITIQFDFKKNKKSCIPIYCSYDKTFKRLYIIEVFRILVLICLCFYIYRMFTQISHELLGIMKYIFLALTILSILYLLLRKGGISIQYSKDVEKIWESISLDFQKIIFSKNDITFFSVNEDSLEENISFILSTDNIKAVQKKKNSLIIYFQYTDDITDFPVLITEPQMLEGNWTELLSYLKSLRLL